MMLKDIISYDVFYEDYITNNMSFSEMAEKYNLKECQIQSLNKKYKIKKDRTLTQEKINKTKIAKYGSAFFISEESKNKRKQTCLEKYGSVSPLGNKNIQTKSKQTNLEKYGVEYIGASSEIQNKIKQTNLDKYGVEQVLSLENIRQKMKQTNLEKYGTEYTLSLPNVIEARKKTMIDKYGVDNPMKVESIKQKVEDTMMQRYGVKHPYQNKEIYKKTRQTCMERYGTTNVFANEEIKEKIKQTNLEKYGVPYHCMTDECMQYSATNSTPNKKFTELLESYSIDFQRELPIDNYIYDFKIDSTLIEINPAATHNSNWGIYNKPGLDKLYHFNKTKTAKEHQLSCIHVFDWDDQNKIINLILPKENKIGARELTIREISDNNIIASFLNENHLQGSCYGNIINIGLYLDDNLIQLMTFGKPRYNKKYEYELLRLCTKNNYIVSGGSEKIFKYFIKTYNPKSVISYCDNAKFSGNVYEKLNFKLVRYGEPSKHWYNLKTKQHITDNLLRQRGYDQLFHTNYGKGTSNEELMLTAGFVEIYDCGQSVWEYIKN